jgi:chemotaxis receptor (MCP) glutamine deamidase CheD
VDLAVRNLLRELGWMDASPVVGREWRAVIAGGNCTMDTGAAPQINVGRQNLAAARKVLSELRIPFDEVDPGQMRGSAMEIDCLTKQVTLKNFADTFQGSTANH